MNFWPQVKHVCGIIYCVFSIHVPLFVSQILSISIVVSIERKYHEVQTFEAK